MRRSVPESAEGLHQLLYALKESLDEVLGHRCRYSKEMLQEELRSTEETFLDRGLATFAVDGPGQLLGWDLGSDGTALVSRMITAGGGKIHRSALVVASWARYAEGVDEAGEPIEVVDRLLPVHDGRALVAQRVQQRRLRQDLAVPGARASPRVLESPTRHGLHG